MMRLVKLFKTEKERDEFIKKHDARKHNKLEHRDWVKWLGFDEKEYPYSALWFMSREAWNYGRQSNG